MRPTEHLPANCRSVAAHQSDAPCPFIIRIVGGAYGSNNPDVRWQFQFFDASR